jgi:hypothetical protein
MPTFVAASGASWTTTSGSVTTTYPTGTTSGDRVFLWFHSIATFATPAGWTEIRRTAIATAPTRTSVLAFFDYDGTTAAPAITITGKGAWNAITLRRADGTKEWALQGNSAATDTTTGTTITPPAATATSGDVSLLFTAGRQVGTTATAVTTTPPTGWTEPTNGDVGTAAGTTTALRQVFSSLSYQAGLTAGTITPGAVTFSLSSAASASHVIVSEVVPGTVSRNGLVLWMDASAITGVTNGTGIVDWTDLSYTGHTMSQVNANTSFRPIYTTGASPTGLPALRFNGTSQFLAVNFPFSITNGYTMFIAHKTGTPPSGSYLFQNGSGSGFGFMCTNTGRSRELIIRSVIDIIDGAMADNTAEIWQADRGSTGNNSFRIDNGTPTTNGSTPAQATAQMTLCCYELQTSGYWPGDVYEVIAYNRQLSGTEITNIHDYLRNKWISAGTPTVTDFSGWGLQVNL